MRLLPDPVTFLWDQGNLEKNLKKHGVTIQEAEEMFASEPFTMTEDSKHSTVYEKRFQVLGRTKTGRKLFTAFIIRDKKVRIISVRDMSTKERIMYERLERDS